MEVVSAIGVIADVAGLVTFVDWALAKSRAKRKKEAVKLQQSLEKIDTNLRQIRVAVNEGNPTEVKRCILLVCQAKMELITELKEVGIELPQRVAPRARGMMKEDILIMIDLCESHIAQAQNELSV